MDPVGSRRSSIEVVSPSSRKRDYKEKPEEYLRIGVKEYWIVDADERLMVVMRRTRGRWVETTVKPPTVYRPRLLPGLEFSIEAVLRQRGYPERWVTAQRL